MNRILTKNDLIPIAEPIIFIDFDGTCTKFRQTNEEYEDAFGNKKFFHIEDIYNKGYYLNLPPQQNVVDAVNFLRVSGCKVAGLTAYLSDSPYAADEKISWAAKYFGTDFDLYLVPYGTQKESFFEVRDTGTAILLDDYTANLLTWETKPGFTGIKLITDINHTHKTWKGPTVDFRIPPEQLASQILDLTLDAIAKDTQLANVRGI